MKGFHPQHVLRSGPRPSLLKNPGNLSFCEAIDYEESRKFIIFGARFLPFCALRVGMTRFRSVFQQTAGSGAAES
jgi:hypothetical protein